jgi:prepilin-type N-terminal cleavage/methylation domain-containing protein
LTGINKGVITLSELNRALCLFNLRQLLLNTKTEEMRNTDTLKRGFTLVEVMIVVAIIALMAAIAIPGFLREQKIKHVADELQLSDSDPRPDIDLVFVGNGSGTIKYKKLDGHGELAPHSAKVVNWEVVEIDGKKVLQKTVK